MRSFHWTSIVMHRISFYYYFGIHNLQRGLPPIVVVVVVFFSCSPNTHTHDLLSPVIYIWFKQIVPNYKNTLQAKHCVYVPATHCSVKTNKRKMKLPTPRGRARERVTAPTHRLRVQFSANIKILIMHVSKLSHFEETWLFYVISS